MPVNEVIYGGETLISLTSDTVTAETLAEGVTAHDASGNLIIGTATVVDISNYYTKEEVDKIVADAITAALGTNGNGYFWKSKKS